MCEHDRGNRSERRKSYSCIVVESNPKSWSGKVAVEETVIITGENYVDIKRLRKITAAIMSRLLSVSEQLYRD